MFGVINKFRPKKKEQKNIQITNTSEMSAFDKKDGEENVKLIVWSHSGWAIGITNRIQKEQAWQLSKHFWSELFSMWDQLSLFTVLVNSYIIIIYHI